MRILLYFIIIILGAWLGYSDKLPEKLIGKLSKLQYLSLLFLLFIMGINIGISKEVISMFYQLGYQAVVLSVLSVVFSIIGVKLVSGFIYKREAGNQGNEH